MSSTGRTGKRDPNDNYPTPAWVGDASLDAIATDSSPIRNPSLRLGLDSGSPLLSIVEPTAGEGAIIKRILSHPDITTRDITAVEVRPEARGDLCALIPYNRVITRDVTKIRYQSSYRYDLAIVNPPFNNAMAIAKWCLENARVVCLLQRASWSYTAARYEFMEQHKPDILQLTNRPSFTGKGTDSADYAWYIFHGSSNSRTYRTKPLSIKERRQ